MRWEEGVIRWRCWDRGRELCTVPDQMVVDKKLEFRVEVGQTDTEGGPVVSREHREEAVDRRAESTTHTVTGHTHPWAWRHTTHTM